MISSLAGLRHAQAMPEHQEQQATVAHLVPAALGCFNQPVNLAAGEVFAVADLRQHPPPNFPVAAVDGIFPFLAC
jgi:hypothetical protein